MLLSYAVPLFCQLSKKSCYIQSTFKCDTIGQSFIYNLDRGKAANEMPALR